MHILIRHFLLKKAVCNTKYNMKSNKSRFYADFLVVADKFNPCYPHQVKNRMNSENSVFMRFFFSKSCTQLCIFGLFSAYFNNYATRHATRKFPLKTRIAFRSCYAPKQKIPRVSRQKPERRIPIRARSYGDLANLIFALGSRFTRPSRDAQPLPLRSFDLDTINHPSAI